MVDQSTLVTCILWHDCRLPIGLLAKVVSNAARPANEVSRLAENAFPLFTYIAFPSTVPELLFFAGENLFVMRLRDGLSSHLSYILSKSLTGDDRATPVLDLCRMGLLVLYPTAADVVEERCIQVDIVAVHGLAGDHIKSWSWSSETATLSLSDLPLAASSASTQTTSLEETLWLKDFLPIDLPHARIMTFEYDARIKSEKMALSSSHAKSLLISLMELRSGDFTYRRPLIFLAQTTGGILVKQALLFAHNDHHFASIEELTIGVMFFATPHQSSDQTVSLLRNLRTREPSRLYMEALHREVDSVANLSSEFRRQLSKYQVFSFYETRETQLGGFRSGKLAALVLDSSSTSLNAAWEDQTLVDADHINMCRFSSRQDRTYVTFLTSIKSILEIHANARENAATRVGRNEYYMVPFTTVTNYTGRGDTARKLEEACLPSKSSYASDRCYVLCGIGGVGKSQVCVKFAEDHRDKFWGIFWINSNTEALIQRSFLEVARKLGLGEDVASVRRHLSETTSDWLLVFDAADDPSISLSKYFPTSGNGSILITTRYANLKLLATVGSSYLEPMEDEDAIAFFSAIRELSGSDPVTRANAVSIVDRLGGLPLALTQASQFIKMKNCTIGQFLQMFEDQLELLRRNTLIGATPYVEILEITFQNIEEMSSEVARDASELMHFLSFIQTEIVYAEELFARAWRNDMELQSSSRVAKYQLRVLCNPANVDWQPSRLKKAIEFLASFALVRRQREGNEISCHLIVLKIAHNRLSKEDLVKYSNITAHTLASAAGPKLESAEYRFREALLSYVASFLRQHNYDFAEDSGVEDLAGILSSFSSAFRDSGQYEKALELDTRAMHLSLRLVGAEHPDTLRSMNRIGRHLRDLQRPHEALQVDSKALESWRQILGDQISGTVDPIECLASDYEMLNRHQEATSLWEEALELRLRLSGEHADETTTTRSHLAGSYRHLGRYTEALKLQETTLLQRQRTFGQEHHGTLNSMHNLAITYWELGRQDEATALLQQLLQISLKTLGDRHPDSINSMHNLAVSYAEVGRHDEVVNLETRVLEFREKNLGIHHQDTLKAMATLAVAFERLNRHSEALDLRLKVVAHREGILGCLDPATLRAMADLATSLETTGNYYQAIDLRKSLVGYLEIQFGRGHSATSRAMADLATSYEITGQQQQSAELKELCRKPEVRDVDASESTNDNSFRSVASDTESKSSDEFPLSTAASTLSASSYHPFTTAIESFVMALMSDLELVFAFEDAMLVTSRRKFLRQHRLSLRDFLINVQPKTAKWRDAVKFFSRKRILSRIAEEICNRSSANSTLLRNAQETGERPSDFDRFQLPVNLGTMSLKMGLGGEHSADQHDSSDESEHSDPGYERELHESDVLQPDRLIQFLIDDVCFSQYKSSLQIFVHQHCSPHTLRFVIRLGNVDAVRGIIERHFDAVAADGFEWLRELKSIGYGNRDIAELLLDDLNKSPWIYFSQPTPQDTAILPEFHVSNCIHEGGMKADLAPKLIVEPLENNEDMKRLIAEHCGLAGVVPKSRDNTNWTGVVAFSGQNQNIALISYNIPGSRYQLISRACEALRRFCGIASYLQKKRLCCNSFTVLRYTAVDGSMAIELRQLGFRLASDIFKVLQLVINNFQSPDLISRCLPQLTRLANDVIRVVCDDKAFANEDVLDFEGCLDRVSLAAQILTLGLYLYSQAHTGSVHPFCLMDPLLHIYLFGTQSLVNESNLAHVQVSLSSFTCMAGVTGDRVAVFGSCHYLELRSSGRSYDLLASPEDLADTWDVWRFITDGRAPHGEVIYAIEIGDGLISCAGEVQHSTDLGITIPKLHWNRGKGDLGSATPFSLHSKALIGTATVNPLCPVDMHQSWLTAHVGMDTLGTGDSYWEPKEVQVGLQLGEYAALMFNTTWARREGKTLKHIHLRPDINLSFLQSDWGLQISYCTGVARRVSLCHLLADVTPVLMDALVQKPPGWSDLRTVHDITGALRGTNFRDWIEALAPALQTDVVRIVRYVLLLLQDTGIDRSGEKLVVIWPQKNEPFGCLKIPCKNATSWARILADSPHCATFAYITPMCLVEDNCECQRLQAAPWHNRSLALNTAVSRFVDSGIVTAGPWTLRHEQSYLIGTPEKYFLGKAIISNNPPRLYISTSMIPERLQARIKERIREKQCTDARAHGVVVLAKL